MPALKGRERIDALVLFVTYALANELAIRFFAAPAFLSLAPGIALAGLILGGFRLWPAVYLATQTISLAHGADFLGGFVIPVANTLQAVAGAYVLKKFGFDPRIRRLKDMLLFMLVALITSLIVPTLGFASRLFDFHYFAQPLPRVTWGSWWTGNIMSTLIAAPFILRWAVKFDLKNAGGRRIIETVVVLCFIIGICTAAFMLAWPQIWGISLVYFLVVALMWTAIRLDTRFMTLALFLTTVIAFLGLFVGKISPAPELLGQRLFQTEIFMVVLAIIFFPLATIEEERKTALKKLESHVLKLQDAVGIRDEFISIASHELKTPVTTLKIYSQVILKDLDTRGETGLAAHIAKMDSQIDRLLSLVEDLLNVSRARRGKLEFNMRAFDLEDLVRETAADMRQSAPGHEIEIRGGLTRPVIADRDRIGQVVVNLMSNAIKYSPKADKIVVTLSENGVAQVSVRDFGIGIDRKHHDKIFDLFYRVSDLGGKTFPGFGIGLHISNEIVKRHNGEIRVRSATGEGSEFSFTLPYAVEAGAPASEPVAIDRGTAFNS